MNKDDNRAHEDIYERVGPGVYIAHDRGFTFTAMKGATDWYWTLDRGFKTASALSLGTDGDGKTHTLKSAKAAAWEASQ